MQLPKRFQYFHFLLGGDPEYWGSGPRILNWHWKMTLWDICPTLLYNVNVGNFLVPEEINNTCRKKMCMEWQIKGFIAHIYTACHLNVTQKSKHSFFLLPFLLRVVWFKNIIHLLTPWRSSQHPSSNSFLSVLDKCHHSSGIYWLQESIHIRTLMNFKILKAKVTST